MNLIYIANLSTGWCEIHSHGKLLEGKFRLNSYEILVNIVNPIVHPIKGPFNLIEVHCSFALTSFLIPFKSIKSY